MLKVSWSEETASQVTVSSLPTLQTDEDEGEVTLRAAATEARARMTAEETILFLFLFFVVFLSFLVDNY